KSSTGATAGSRAISARAGSRRRSSGRRESACGNRPPMPLLELRDVEARYGPVKALHGVSLDVEEGELVAVLGANGAGKTTMLRAISGTVRRTGELLFAGERVPRAPEAVARRGVAHVPEGRGTFAELSVRDNLRLGAYTRRGREHRHDLRRSEEHTSELQSLAYLVCRLLLEKKN